MNIIATCSRQLWKKGKLVGQKAPLRLRDIWAIRVRLQIAERTRDLALFDLAIDSKLRACDLLSITNSKRAIFRFFSAITRSEECFLRLIRAPDDHESMAAACRATIGVSQPPGHGSEPSGFGHWGKIVDR